MSKYYKYFNAYGLLPKRLYTTINKEALIHLKSN